MGGYLPDKQSRQRLLKDRALPGETAMEVLRLRKYAPRVSFQWMLDLGLSILG